MYRWCIWVESRADRETEVGREAEIEEVNKPKKKKKNGERSTQSRFWECFPQAHDLVSAPDPVNSLVGPLL